MTEKKNPKRRTEVKDLPRKEKELSKDEQKKVKGGARGVAAGRLIVGGGTLTQQDDETL